MHIPKLIIAVALAATVTACSNPDEAARAALTEAGGEWREAFAVQDPADRVAVYDDVIATVRSIAEDYPETADGRAIATGIGIVDGLSVERMQGVRDQLAARAACYSKPTVACLTPFASRNTQEAANDDSAEAVFAAAREAVCAKGFAAADAELAQFKINRPVYSQELIQVALAAAACNKPQEIKAAIDAYRAAEPATGGNRASALLSILSTPDLEPAWASVLSELDAALQSRQLGGDDAATVALTMAVRYAEIGDTRAALVKYAYFTDTLNYEADMGSKQELAAALIMAGAPAQGHGVLASYNMPQLSVIAVHQAAAALGRLLRVVGDGAAQPQLYNVKDIRDYFAPVDAAQKARYAAAAATIEAEADKLAPAVGIRDNAIGLGGLDTAYGLLAMVRQRLGEADKATALMGKALAVRGRLLQAGAERVGIEYVAPFATLLALGQGKHAEAAQHSLDFNVRHDYVRLILKSASSAMKVEDLLTLAAQVEPNNARSSYTNIIESLIDSGRLDEAETVIAAYAGNADEKRAFQWRLLNQAASSGDLRRAEAVASKYALINGPEDRLRVLATALGSEKIGGDRGDAEPLIREFFDLGRQLDARDGGVFDRNTQMIAQNAAWHAFYNGYTDLGLELYRAAERKDQRPLFEAFNDKVKASNYTAILMTAHDSLSGEQLGYVIDAAIRHLGKDGA